MAKAMFGGGPCLTVHGVVSKDGLAAQTRAGHRWSFGRSPAPLSSSSHLSPERSIRVPKGRVSAGVEGGCDPQDSDEEVPFYLHHFLVDHPAVVVQLQRVPPLPCVGCNIPPFYCPEIAGVSNCFWQTRSGDGTG